MVIFRLLILQCVVVDSMCSMIDFCKSLERPCFVILERMDESKLISSSQLKTPSKSVHLLDNKPGFSPQRRSPRISNKALNASAMQVSEVLDPRSPKRPALMRANKASPVSRAFLDEVIVRQHPDSEVATSNEHLQVTPEASSKKLARNFYVRSRQIIFDDPQPKKPAEMSPITRMCFYKKTLKRLDTIKSRVQRALAQDMHKCTLKRQRSRESMTSRTSYTKMAKRRKQSKVFGSVGHGIKKRKPLAPAVALNIPVKANAGPSRSIGKSLNKADNVGLVISFKKADKENVQERKLVGEDEFCMKDDVEEIERKRKFFKAPRSVTLNKSMKLGDETSAPIDASNITMKTKRKPLKVVNLEHELKSQGALEERTEHLVQDNREDVTDVKNSFAFLKNSEEKRNAAIDKKPWRLSLTPEKSAPCVTVPAAEEPLTSPAEEMEPQESSTRFFPVFYKRDTSANHQRCSKESSGKKIVLPKKDDKAQMIIDAGQKRLGSITCSDCGVLYNPGDADDEYDHARFHERFVQHLKFPGWQNENVVADFLDGRVIMVSGLDASSYWKKIEDVLEIADRDLGFSEVGIRNKSTSKAYLYVSNRAVVGCLIAEKVTSGYRVLSDSGGKDADTMWRCSMVPRPVRCGVSRIWVAANHRRKGVASRLLDAMRANFVYAELLKKQFVAFSDPTPMGMSFARKYSETPFFLVYNK